MNCPHCSFEMHVQEIKENSLITLYCTESKIARIIRNNVEKWKESLPANVTIVILSDKLTSIDIISEEEMNKLGWYRKEKE